MEKKLRRIPCNFLVREDLLDSLRKERTETYVACNKILEQMLMQRYNGKR
jgi:hypothetical protein